MSTDWRAAGYRADATRVANLARGRYSNPAKDAVRTWIVRELAAVEPTLVLDLWGGGRSAEEMTAAGLPVLSVDRPDGFREYGISAARAKRALTICAEAGGYRSGWGSAVKFAPECDAMWADFMGHLCPATIKTLRACSHMKALAVTLMAERMKGAENWAVETWSVAYRALIERYTGLSVSLLRKYQRDGGQWVLVFLAFPKGTILAQRAHDREYDRARRAKPEYRARMRAYQEAQRAKPEYRARKLAERARRATDPEFRAREQARDRARRATPEYRARRRARETTPEFRAREQAYRAGLRAGAQAAVA